MRLDEKASKLAAKRFLTLEEDMNKKHNFKYNYEKVIYLNNSTPIIIICPVHGDFEQLSGTHLSGCGCPKCGSLTGANTNKKNREGKYFSAFKEIHGNLYDYEECNFTHIHNKLKIICPTHGVFEQIAGVHLWGSGCPKCSWERTNYSRYK